MPDSPTIEIGTLITGLGGGLALFLFGMRLMTEALKIVAGTSMKNLLAKLTSNRFSATLAGTLVTAVIQSSSVTTVLTVGFVTAGLMNLSQSVGVIIGANIGTTITGQIIALQISKFGLLMIALGFVLEISSKKERYRQYGTALMGLGLLFFGMELMSNATTPLRSWRPFIEFMQEMKSPLIGIGIGIVFTAIVQSSSATTGVVIVLATQGLMSLESGIAIILGANVGTCITAVVSAIGRPREAMQVAIVHVFYNLIGTMLWFFFISELAELVRQISPQDTARQVANAHTVFNVANALIFLPFTGLLSRLVTRIVPVPELPESRGKPVYLDELFIDQPALALDRAKLEIGRQAEIVKGMLSETLTTITGGGQDDLDRLKRDNRDVDELHGAIVTYLGRLSQQNLVDPQPHRIYQDIAITNYLENMGDVIENNFVEGAEKAIRRGVHISAATIRQLQALNDEVVRAFDQAILAITNGDLDAAKLVVDSKSRTTQLAEKASMYLMTRLVAREPNRLASFRFETDIIENLMRLNTLTRRISRIVLEANGDGSTVANQAPVIAVNSPDNSETPESNMRS